MRVWCYLWLCNNLETSPHLRQPIGHQAAHPTTNPVLAKVQKCGVPQAEVLQAHRLPVLRYATSPLSMGTHHRLRICRPENTKLPACGSCYSLPCWLFWLAWG